MSENITISKQKPADITMDHAALRSAGLAYIEKLSSGSWTDYNVHDPGITMLELLCYAITDVGYRTTFAVPDILAAAANNEEHLKEQFFSAKEILPTRACTETDYRKLFIDIIGVKNAWLFKATENLYTDRKDDAIKGTVPGHTNYTAFDLNGIYTIKIELDELTPEEALLSAAEKQARVDAVISNVKAVYHCNRNLCEDLDDVTVMENQKVLICADIEISAQADATAVYAELLYQINDYLSPQVKQYSLSEMMALKKEDGNLYRMDEVFEGPVLQHGFITDEDVENSSIRQVIYSSDLISLVMNIDGVVNVKELLLNYCDTPDTKRHEWCLKVADGKKPVLCFDKLAIHFRKDVIPVPVKNDAAVQIFQLRLLQERNAMNKMSYEDRTYDTGTFKDIADYSSVIHHLPLTYGVSNYGLPATADNARRAKAKQLKAYLLFFDQLLADHLSQLANTGELFKVKNPNTASSLPQTYFYQKIKADDVNGVEDIIKNYAQFDEPGQGLSEVVKKYDNAIDRKNRFLDHLMARFAENFNDHVLQLYSLSGQTPAAELIIDKAAFLNEYPALSANRAAGYVYTDQACSGIAQTVWDTDNISGLEHRICRLLGIGNYKRRTLSSIPSQVYTQTNADNSIEYKFKITDPADGRILLHNTREYTDTGLCEQDYKLTMRLAVERNSYSTAQNIAGQYSFTIVDNANNALAASDEHFSTSDEMEAALSYLMRFIKENYSDEGLFVVEHILLRPDAIWMKANGHAADGKNYRPVCVTDDCEDDCNDDPYSFRITVVLPATSLRFSNMDFRGYIEDQIRLETPAHIFPKICWVDNKSLLAFEGAYKKWLELKQADKISTDEGIAALQHFIEVLYNLKNIYPPGTLTECGSDNEHPMILGRTNLGNM